MFQQQQVVSCHLFYSNEVLSLAEWLLVDSDVFFHEECPLVKNKFPFPRLDKSLLSVFYAKFLKRVTLFDQGMELSLISFALFEQQEAYSS